jgi:signal transduction histidine kinase
VIDEMVSVQQKIPRQKRIQVIQEIQTIDDFQTSPSLFYYALNSLIDNAFRYYNESPRGDSFVKITVERKRDDVVIRIIDNGVGIPVTIDSDSLFHMFTRGSERSLTGGMGLFIASTAVRKLQGEIKFQRSPDFILTEFIMILPLKMDFSKIEHPKERGKILPATTGLIATLDSRFEK